MSLETLHLPQLIQQCLKMHGFNHLPCCLRRLFGDFKKHRKKVVYFSIAQNVLITLPGIDSYHHSKYVSRFLIKIVVFLSLVSP